MSKRKRKRKEIQTHARIFKSDKALIRSVKKKHKLSEAEALRRLLRGLLRV